MLNDPNARYVLFGLTLLGACSGLLGTFAFLKRKSLLSDALAHAALPGICLTYLLIGSKELGWLLLGAFGSGLLGVLSVAGITRYTRLKEDAALALVLSVFFGFGIVLLTFIQQQASGYQSGLDKFLFGAAAAMLPGDVLTLLLLSILVGAVVLLLFKEFKLVSFDPQYAQVTGFPAGKLDLLLMGLIALTVIAGLQSVGVVLMVAMMITPAATARLWTNRLGVMCAISALLGAVAGVGGTWLSTLTTKMPTGPVMVLCASFFFFLSLFVRGAGKRV